MMGGGFFGSGASSTKQTSTSSEVGQQLNESTGSTALGFGNLSTTGKNSNLNLSVNMTDGGAVKAAVDMAGRVLESQNNSRAVDYDIFKVATDSNVSVLRDAANLGYDGLKVNSDLLSKTLSEQTAANANFLGKVENWSELVDSNSKAFMQLSDQQTKRAYDFQARENDANRAILIDANASIGNAWESANRGLMNFAYDTTNKYATMQNEAVKQISTTAQFAQTATQRAMDMIFESTKAPDERVLSSSMKWVIGGLLGLVAVFVVAPKLTGN